MGTIDPLSAAMPNPKQGERPTAYADRVGEWYVTGKSDHYRKNQGLFLTPVGTADFMAGQIRANARQLKILDPAAGAGVLCCAAIETLVSYRTKTDEIELVAYEVDDSLIPTLRTVLDYLVTWCQQSRGILVTVRIEAADFILANAESARSNGRFCSAAETKAFDVVIANPPYFKIGKSDTRATAVSEVVHGQPNIYSLFMAVSAALLRQGGDLIFVTPRSFASGPYFRQFRTVFFNMIRPSGIHVFRSRRQAFRRDAVLQENVIFFGLRHDCWHKSVGRALVTISTSDGVEDICGGGPREVSTNAVLDMGSREKILRLPLDANDDDAFAVVDSWPSNLDRLGMRISTGPVVAFRAKKFIASKAMTSDSHVPLLWMNHVHAMRATWPQNRHKPEYIARYGAKSLLVPSRNYVLIRRFSAKEQARRLTAAPYIAADFGVPAVGLENHLNYIHRPGGTLSEDEAWGLAALYNSRLLDTWFRATNGNTQVSATELRAMSLPSLERIVALGRRAKQLGHASTGLDSLVESMVAHPKPKEAAIGWS